MTLGSEPHPRDDAISPAAGAQHPSGGVRGGRRQATGQDVSRRTRRGSLTWQHLGDVAPAVAEDFVALHQRLLLLISPAVTLDVGAQVMVPPLAGLLSYAPVRLRGAKGRIQGAGNDGPVAFAML